MVEHTINKVEERSLLDPTTIIDNVIAKKKDIS